MFANHDVLCLIKVGEFAIVFPYSMCSVPLGRTMETGKCYWNATICHFHRRVSRLGPSYLVKFAAVLEVKDWADFRNEQFEGNKPK